jgi:hypothetical protein
MLVPLNSLLISDVEEEYMDIEKTVNTDRVNFQNFLRIGFPVLSTAT